MNGAEAKVVFAAEWPFATDASLDFDASEGGRQELAVGTFFGRCNLGEREVEAGRGSIRWTIPPGCFDSGVVELRFRASSQGSIVLRALTLDESVTDASGAASIR